MDLTLLGTVPAWISAAVLVWGAIWAYFRFKRERVDAPQIEFTIAANFFGLSDGSHAAEYVLVFNNKGKTRVQVDRIKLRVRGIKAGEKIGYLNGQQLTLNFPHSVVPTLENIVPKKFGYIFFEPGVRQEFRHISIVPPDIDLLLVHAAFNYIGNGDPHTAEKVVRLPNASVTPVNQATIEPALAAS